MKVGVDAVLLGALAEPNTKGKVLDVGCGSGILMLMLAQRFPLLEINGIDINTNAIQQAKENIDNSSFKNKFEVLEGDFCSFNYSNYDYFICNPPFFKGTQKEIGIDRYEARAAEMMPLNSFFKNCKALGNPESKIGLIYPFEYFDEVIQNAQQSGWYENRIVYIKGNTEAQVKRVFFEFTRIKTIIEEKSITIEKSRNNYTEAYKELTKAFYLNF